MPVGAVNWELQSIINHLRLSSPLPGSGTPGYRSRPSRLIAETSTASGASGLA
jgi:hypothetical protein